MKIKVIRRFERFLAPEGCEEEVYDIYYGFTGLPTTFPFCTKWKIDKAGLLKEELLEWFKKNACGYRKIIIKL
jgi:hypothetical protein